MADEQSVESEVLIPDNFDDFPIGRGNILGESLIVCGVVSDHAQWALVITEELDSLDAFASLDIDTMDTILTGLGKMDQDDGGFKFTGSQRLNLKALIWWARDLVDRDQELETAFTADDLYKALEQMRSYKEAKDSKMSVPRPPKFGLKKGNIS